MRLLRTVAASEVLLSCSFCGKSQSGRRKVVRRADGLYICSECVDRIVEALANEPPARPRTFVPAGDHTVGGPAPSPDTGLVGDRDRERALAALREHFAQGRLPFDDFTARCDEALRASTQADLRHALRDLPSAVLLHDRQSGVPSVLRLGVRGAAPVAVPGAWLLFSFVLVLLLGLTLLLHGASGATLLVFLLAWLALTYLLSRHWRRGL